MATTLEQFGETLPLGCGVRYLRNAPLVSPYARLSDCDTSSSRSENFMSKTSASGGTAVVKTPTYCALRTSRCGAIASVEDGKLVALKPNPSHPTGKALCIKGRVAPELVYHPERLLQPLKRRSEERRVGKEC